VTQFHMRRGGDGDEEGRRAEALRGGESHGPPKGHFHMVRRLAPSFLVRNELDSPACAARSHAPHAASRCHRNAGGPSRRCLNADDVSALFSSGMFPSWQDLVVAAGLGTAEAAPMRFSFNATSIPAEPQLRSPSEAAP
jgi:hypothetical protein